jgi:UDP-glucose 6-dehydrogenase
MHARDAELIKYGGNCFLYMKVIFANLLCDVAKKRGRAWNAVKDAVAADPRVGPSHMEPFHRSGHGGRPGRGAGGHCFIKDFAAFTRLYKDAVHDASGLRALRALETHNNRLLLESGKDLDLLQEVYGSRIMRGNR